MNLTKILNCMRSYLSDSAYRFNINKALGLYNHMPDEAFLKKAFYYELGRELNLDNPRTFNEKLQWLKLYNRKPIYTTMVDKVSAKDFAAKIIGEEYIIPTIGVWDDPEKIDFDKLPNSFVLKCNHNSGTGMCICRDKKELDINKVKKKLKKGLKQDYERYNREWPYKNVPRRIICEKYMEDESGELKDYKFMAFDGEVKCSFVCSERFSEEGLHVTFYDNDWNIMPFERHYPRAVTPHPRPVCFEEMKELAAKLSKGIPFVRVDFYEIQGRPYFGELTFFPGSGFEEFTPESWDYTLGSWIDLEKVEK